MALKILILGGTSHARLLAERIAREARFEGLLSFAGRTASLQRPEVPHRVGGFGGVDGLSELVRTHGFNALIDATHPFAARMSESAVRAAAIVGVPLLRIEDPAWGRVAGDRWHEVSNMAAAAAGLGAERRRVLLTIGRQEVDAFRAAPQHAYLVRAIDPFPLPLPDAQLLLARGPFALTDERRLLEREAIDVIVSKNAGTPATYAKIAAARELGRPVIMVQRPELASAETVANVDAALAWLARLHDGSGTLRGE